MLFLVKQDFDGARDQRPDDKYSVGTRVKLTEFLAHWALAEGLVEIVKDTDIDTSAIENKAVITEGRERSILGIRRK